ncbi:MAG: M48 family metallopeptidase [Candidatus Acidiferrales bacterium]
MPLSHRLTVGLLTISLVGAINCGAAFARSQRIPYSHTVAALVKTNSSAQTPAQVPASQSSPKTDQYTLSPERYQQAVEFSRARYRLYFINVICGVLVLLLVLRWRLAPKFRDWAERLSSRRFIQAAIYTPLLVVTLAIAGLATATYGHHLSRHYGISVQGWDSWMWDWAKGQFLTIVISVFLVWILYGVIRRSPRRWWFYFWLACLPLLVFLIFLAPVVIDPLFNKFEPLQQKDPQLVSALEQVVRRTGLDIPPERMFWMQASEKTKALDAYVTGIGASKRVVVFDNTIQRMSTSETLFVFGHESGHYVLGHVWKGILFFAALAFVLLYAGFALQRRLLARWGMSCGIRSLEDWASLPVLLLIISVFAFFTDPVANSFSRHLEHQADIYGLEVTHSITPDSGEVAARAFQVLGEVDLADPAPSPFIEFWLYDHPPLGKRLDFARTYNPWEAGKEPEFVK